jgi:hypothetical protein
VRAEVEDLVALEGFEDGLAERDAPVVECDGDLHASDHASYLP